MKYGMYERNKVKVKAPGIKAHGIGTTQANTDLPRFSYKLQDQIIHLQKTVGNQVVQRLFKSKMIQAKLRISHPNDKYEQEADHIAALVMRKSETSCPECLEEEKEQIQTKPMIDQITPLIQQQTDEEEKEIKTKSVYGPQMRQQVEEMEEVEKGSIKTKLLNRQCSQHGVISDARIHFRRCAGKPLSQSVCEFFEPKFGHNFRHVRVHTCRDAVQMCTQLNAQAFTYRNNIFFNQGKYSPETSSGKRLLAHELTHVVQQSHKNKQDQIIQRAINIHDAGCTLGTIDSSKTSAEIGAMSGGRFAYGSTNLSVDTPGNRRVMGRMLTPTQGEVWIDNADIFPGVDVQMYLTNQFGAGTCEGIWVFGHEMLHWWIGCHIFERKIPQLQRDLDALPGPTTRQSVNGNRIAVEQARQDLDTRMRTILRCFRVEVCRDIARSHRRIDLYDYPRAFSSCPQPRPPVPPVPPLPQYLSTCASPPAGCPRPIT